ncbi:TPA: DEAD/DEAH box helicase [Citrobacter sedlakii]|nr:DEAD/DEAH box helicase [Citrobacter sedlakii]
MQPDDLFACTGLNIRDIQREYSGAVYTGLSAKGRVALLSADTGVGKTLGYLITALRIIEKNPKAQFVIATSTHALMTQIINHDGQVISQLADRIGIQNVTFARLLGKANYVSPEKVCNVIRTYPASSADERRVLNALAKWHGALADFEDEYGAISADIAPDSVTYSLWDTVEYIRDVQKEAIKARFIVTSHAMVITDILNKSAVFGDKENKYLIIDEADMFADMAELQQQRRLSLKGLQYSLDNHLSPTKKKSISFIMDKIRDAAGSYHFITNPDAIELYKDVVEELKWIGNSITDDEVRENFITSLFSWEPAHFSGEHIGIGVSQRRKDPALIRFNPFVSRNIGAYTTQWESTLMTSATLSITSEPSRGMEWIVRVSGLTEDLISIRDIFTPESYGRMELTIAGQAFASIFEDSGEQKLSDEWLTKVAGIIRETNEADRPVVVLTASHDESHEIAARLQSTTTLPVYVQNAGQPVSELVKQYIRKPGILISAGAFVGLSLRGACGDQIFQDLIITRMRFAPPDREGAESYQQYLHQLGYETTVQSITRRNYVNQVQKVVRTGKQAVGRGIRSENDFIRVTILDPRFPEPQNISSKYRVLVNIIPVRFAAVYRNCSVLSPVRNTEEIIC